MSYQPPPGQRPPLPYQPYPPQRAQARRGHGLRNGLLIGAGALVGLVVFLVAIAAAFTPSSAHHQPGAGAGQATTHGQPRPDGAVFGRPADDGDFRFVVKSMNCGKSAAAAVRAGGTGETVPIAATECIVTMTITDDKNTAQTFYDSDQYAYDARGRQFSADTSAGIYLKGDQDATQVNPGITITARVPFQFPAGVRIVRLVLHDSAFSDGVPVQVAR